ncbi:MAG TPA: hypothetical protein VLG25_01990 [Patescibacteria group bacterium]|nr:hypothetical protein [Patescibacteria group bacterium]
MSVPSLVDTLRATNTEIDCFIIGALKTDEPMTNGQIEERLNIASGKDINDILPINSVNFVLRRMPDSLVIKAPIPNHRYKQYIKNLEFGDQATAQGGLNLRLSERSGFPLRWLAGEYMPPLQGGRTNHSSLEIRLGVLACLDNLHVNRWYNVGLFYENLEGTEGHKDTIRGHLISLVASGLLQRQDPIDLKEGTYYKIASEAKYENSPKEIIHSYVSSVAKIINGDPLAIELGLMHMDRFMSGKSPNAAMLLLRHLTSSKRSGHRKTKQPA